MRYDWCRHAHSQACFVCSWHGACRKEGRQTYKADGREEVLSGSRAVDLAPQLCAAVEGCAGGDGVSPGCRYIQLNAARQRGAVKPKSSHHLDRQVTSVMPVLRPYMAYTDWKATPKWIKGRPRRAERERPGVENKACSWSDSRIGLVGTSLGVREDRRVCGTDELSIC